MANSKASNDSAKFKRVRFTYNDDLAFLREFVGQNPIMNPQAWEIVQQHLFISTGKTFSIRTLKQHLVLLIENWLEKEKVDKVRLDFSINFYIVFRSVGTYVVLFFRSGIEEPYSEKDILLQEASSLCKEFNFQEKKKRTSRDSQIMELGKKARNKCAETLLSPPNVNIDLESDDNEIFTFNEHDYSKFMNNKIKQYLIIFRYFELH